MDDTICAISTSSGNGAISIIRISGKDAINIVSKIFVGKNLNKVQTHTINYGYIKDSIELVDEVLVNIMKSPKSYTTEDVVEINSHGGINTTNKIVELLLQNGCRLAEPGEFTKRAFLNGRLDLTEAESVNDLIQARNDSARKLALNNLKGNLKNEIDKIKKQIVDVMANIEVNIDYPEYEDIEVVTNESLIPKLINIKEEIELMLTNSKNGRLIKEGINVAIIGKPNVGKSSILNMLLDEEKAIVTDIPGTTRDIVEGTITLNGFLINFIDTAGIRETDDIVEKIGVEKSKKVKDNADLIIIVLNNNDIITDYELELIKEIDEERRIIFVNKSDLDNNIVLNEKFVKGNTKDFNGLNSLKKEIITKFNLDKFNHDITYLSNVRQIDLLKKALDNINSALENLKNSMPIDIVEIDINNAWSCLGEITGEVYKDELLDTLFSNFCLGK